MVNRLAARMRRALLAAGAAVAVLLPLQAAAQDKSIVMASTTSTPGITGCPGKCPTKKSSLPVTFLVARRPDPGSCASTRSTIAPAVPR